jgi:hypothetical protein
LKDAELKWTACHRYVGRGIEQWGNIAGEFVKPVELELVSRLLPVFESSGYTDWQAQQGHNVEGKPTLGAAIYVLSKFKTLPNGLQEHIRSLPLRTYEDKKLIRQLRVLLDMRNRAFHPEPFSAGDLFSLRQRIFDDGLLASLLATFS